MLQEVIKELNMPAGARAKVNIDQVRGWMKSKNADTLGATYVFLSEAEHVKRITPPISFDEAFRFMLNYYEFCLKTNPESKWADSRYSAGADLVGWFTALWDAKRDEKYFKAIKERLAGIYLTGTAEMKDCIEHAIIEHLFERKVIRKFFSDWRDNPQLRPAYDEGKLWVDHGGTSPLTERRNR